jgi:hypothetical protein
MRRAVLRLVNPRTGQSLVATLRRKVLGTETYELPSGELVRVDTATGWGIDTWRSWRLVDTESPRIFARAARSAPPPTPVPDRVHPAPVTRDLPCAPPEADWVGGRGE